VRMPATEYFESRTARSTAGREGTEELVHAALEGLGPNVEGNRRAVPALARKKV
jgi:hypothetical protein